MGQASVQRRAGRPRRTLIEAKRLTDLTCWLCGLPVDMTLHRGPRNPHPLSHVVDEIVPVVRGGSDRDPTNTRSAHRICNGSRGTKPMVPWDPAWNPDTCNPEEVRARCRHLAHTHMTAHEPILRPF